MINVPDQQGLFPLSEIELVDMTVGDLFEEGLGIKRIACPTWTDESFTDVGIVILWTLSVLCKWTVDEMNQAARQNFLLTVTDRQQLRYLCHMLQYTLGESAASLVSVRFTSSDGHPEFTIPAGTKVATAENAVEDAVVFETLNDEIVSVGVETVDIICQQGETVSQEIVGSSTGLADQKFYLKKRPVVWQSETVAVYDGVNWVTWSRVDNWLGSGASSLHYAIELDNDGYYYIVFGDGTNGKIPASGTNSIRCTYRQGGGTVGNVAAASVIELLSDLEYVDSVTNPLAASGGSDQETVAHAKKFAVAQAFAGDHIINEADVPAVLAAFSSAYGIVAQAKGVNRDNLTMDVYVLPGTGDTLADELKADLTNYLSTRIIAGKEIEVQDANFVDIIYTVTVYVVDNYHAPAVAEQVRQALVKLGSALYRDTNGFYPNEFGKDVTVGDVYVATHAVAGVYAVDVAAPSATIAIGDNAIRRIQEINITTIQGGNSVSYFDMSQTL